MAGERLTKKRWSQLIRKALSDLAKSATEERGSIEEAAKATFLSRDSIDKMKSNGSGGVESWIKLIAYKYRLADKDVIRFFENFPTVLREIGPQDDLDRLFTELRTKYSPQELAAWMQLLLAKAQIEDLVQVEVKAKLNSNKKKSKKRKLLRAAESRRKK